MLNLRTPRFSPRIDTLSRREYSRFARFFLLPCSIFGVSEGFGPANPLHSSERTERGSRIGLAPQLLGFTANLTDVLLAILVLR